VQQFLNREVSLLDFNARVLSLAEDKSNPLLERLKFICICSTNLDEFFEIRVAGIKQKIIGGCRSQRSGSGSASRAPQNFKYKSA